MDFNDTLGHDCCHFTNINVVHRGRLVSSNRRMHDKKNTTATMIGNDSHFVGEIKGSAPVIVLGKVEGSCELDQVLTIESAGSWLGTIQAVDVIVNGRVEGDVQASGKLEIGAKGEIKGNVSAGFLAIASGAVIQGDIKMTGNKEPVHFEEKRKKA